MAFKVKHHWNLNVKVIIAFKVKHCWNLNVEVITSCLQSIFKPTSVTLHNKRATEQTNVLYLLILLQVVKDT